MSTVERLEKETMSLREINSKLIYEIEKMGGEIDISVARIEHFINRLVDLEIITNEMRWTEQKMWELRLKKQLVPLRDQLREHIQKAIEEQKRERIKQKIWTPGAPGSNPRV